MEELNLDLLGLEDIVLSFESFKARKQYIIKEMATKPIDLEPRPNRMKKPPMADIATSPTRYFPQLYIQDELRYMLIDKYGKTRGEKTFDGLLDAMSSRPGAFYQQGGLLAAEKAGLIDALRKPSNGDYWQYSYYELWKEWMQANNHPINIDTPVTTPTPVAKPTPAPTIQTRPVATDDNDEINAKIERAFNALTGRGASDAEKAKSKARVDKILNSSNGFALARKMANATSEVYKLVQRAYYAAVEGSSDIAKLFWNKAVSLSVSESVDGTFTGLDIILENNTVGSDTYNYHLCDDGGCSTEWDIPLLLEIGTTFTHSFGKYKVSTYENGDKDIMCDKIDEHRTNESSSWDKAKVLQFAKDLIEDGRHGDGAYDIAGSILDDEAGLKDAIIKYIEVSDPLGWLANKIA